MAIDLGDKWIGVAVSDPLRLIATPLLTRRCPDAEAIVDTVCNLVEQNNIKLLVAGLPCSPDGGIGLQAEKVNTLVQAITSRVKIPVVFQDERFSTHQAQKILKSKKAKPGSRDDALAAAIILQEYLDGNQPPGNRPEPE